MVKSSASISAPEFFHDERKKKPNSPHTRPTQPNTPALSRAAVDNLPNEMAVQRAQITGGRP